MHRGVHLYQVLVLAMAAASRFRGAKVLAKYETRGELHRSVRCWRNYWDNIIAVACVLSRRSAEIETVQPYRGNAVDRAG